MEDLIRLLQQHGVQPTPQRLAVARFVLHTDRHPTAEEVFAEVKPACPTLSKGTIYNTLNLLVERGLLVARNLKEGAVVFDAKTGRHHHLIEEPSGRIRDIPAEAIGLELREGLSEFEITEYQVTLRGRPKKRME